MKRILGIALTLCMALSLFTVSANAATPKPDAVVVSPQILMVDGVVKNAQKYNIDGANYFKLRDLAYLLNGTGSQFGVGWDGATGTVTITTGEAYTPVGGELETGADMSASTVPSAQTIKINGETRSDLYVYNIGGANFFKLRDLGTALGFEVDYDAANNAATVATKGGAPATQSDAPAAQGEVTTMEILGLPKDIHYIANPTRRGEYVTNILYAAATGNYGFAYSGYIETPLQIGWIKQIFPELFGTWKNTKLGIANVDHTYRLERYGAQGVTMAEAAKNTTAAISAAKSIYDQLHASGKVTDGMTQLQIAQVYYDFMKGYGVKGTELYKNPNSAEAQKYDSAYACLVNKVADCSGRAAAFNLLMHLEGIPAVGIGGTVQGSGHIMNYLLLDGEEYMCDFHEGDFPIHTVSGFDSDFRPYDGRLAVARAIAKAYAEKSLSVFTAAVENGFTGENFKGTDSERYTLKTVNGNMTVEYLGNYKYKYTPTDGSKFTYVEGAEYSYHAGTSDDSGAKYGYGSDGITGAIEDGSIIMNHAKGYADAEKEDMDRPVAALKNHGEFTITYNGVTYSCETQGVE